jgi:hypothetical protein
MSQPVTDEILTTLRARLGEQRRPDRGKLFGQREHTSLLWRPPHTRR